MKINDNIDNIDSEELQTNNTNPEAENSNIENDPVETTDSNTTIEEEASFSSEINKSEEEEKKEEIADDNLSSNTDSCNGDVIETNVMSETFDNTKTEFETLEVEEADIENNAPELHSNVSEEKESDEIIESESDEDLSVNTDEEFISEEEAYLIDDSKSDKNESIETNAELSSDENTNETEETTSNNDNENNETEEDEDIIVPENDLHYTKEFGQSNRSSNKDTKSATKLAVLPKKYGKKYRQKNNKNKKSWFEPAGYTESVSTIHNILKTIVYIIFITVVGCVLAYYAITRINDLYAFVKDTDEVEIVVPENATVNEIADILYNAGIIEYPNFFKFYAHLKNASERYDFKAGTYVVNPMMNYDQLFIWLEGTTTQSIKRITIPEGYTVDEIIDLFVAEGFGTREGFINAIQNYEFENKFVKALDASTNTDRHYRLEGYLYPDTYDVYTDKSEAYYIYKLLDRFEEVYSEKFQQRANELGLTMDQIITIASMIEKETRIQSEYEIVSSVFHNRINNFVQFPLLESDATVVYAIQIATGERVGELSNADLKIDSKYNTYKYKGLPPGPISNPGYEAIASALYPESTNYYFFVSTLEGETFFASTLKEHEANIEKVNKINEEYRQNN